MSNFGDDPPGDKDQYGTFQDSSGDELNFEKDFRDQNAQVQIAGKEVQQPGQFYPPPADYENQGVYDAFRMSSQPNNNNTKQGSKGGSKKELSLQQCLSQAQQKLGEKSSIQNKISALKQLAERIKQSKGNSQHILFICQWLDSMRLIDNFFHEDSHPQILRNMSTILKFLYENGRFNVQEISLFAFYALKANEQYLKAVQSLISFLTIQDLVTIFQLVCRESDLDNHNLVAILGTIVNNKYFFEQSLAEHDRKQKPPAQNNFLSQQYQIQDQAQLPILACCSVQHPQKPQQTELTKKLTTQLFTYLISATQNNMQTFYPILNKLITSKHIFLSHELSTTLSELLKNNKINAIWILEHCLKIDFGQSNGKKGNKMQGKFSFVAKLVNQHLYEYLLVMLTKVRFNKVVVDKILAIFIMLSKNYKPLDEVYMQFIWKILGLNSKEEKEREQFFNFVRDLLRNQSNFTQQSVYFIFFQVLMSLKAEWFSLKILDCLELLFMRLNEDLKLISYIDQTYEILDSDLVGLDKFWYIYFHSSEQKVTKKCKDFLWKLTTYKIKSSTKVALMEEYINKILQFMSQCCEDEKMEICSKGFEMIDKLMEEVSSPFKKDNQIQVVHMIVKNQCRDAVGLKKFDLKLSQKCRLDYLRQQIAMAITPNNNKIKLLAKGQILKGEKMTVKDLGLQNGVTIMVFDDEFEEKMQKQKNNQNLQNIINQLSEIFGSQFSQEMLKFIGEKMEGHSIDAIIQAIMNQEKISAWTVEFNQMNQKKRNQEAEKAHYMDDIKAESSEAELIKQLKQNKKQGQINEPIFESQKQSNEQQHEGMGQQGIEITKFSQIISSNPTYISKLLTIASQSNKTRGWQTIKLLPKCPAHIQEITQKLVSQNWSQLFPDQIYDDMSCAYHAHLLKCILEQDKSKPKKYSLTNVGFRYLVKWLIKLGQDCSMVLITQVTRLLAFELQICSKSLLDFRGRVNKKEQVCLLGSLITECLEEAKKRDKKYLGVEDQQFLNWLVKLLRTPQKKEISLLPALNIAQIINYLLLNSEPRLLQILEMPLEDIVFLIKTHGFIGQYIYLFALARLFAEFSYSDSCQKYCNKLLDLIDYGFGQWNEETGAPCTIVYVYDIVNCILSHSNKHRSKQTQITLKCISKICQSLQKLEPQQLLSILSLLKLSLQKLYGEKQIELQGQDQRQEQNSEMRDESQIEAQKKAHQQQKEQQQRLRKEKRREQRNRQKQMLNQQITQFAKWLFKGYLFDLQNPGRHIRDKVIRKQCYQILQIIAEYSFGNAIMLIHFVLEIHIQGSNRDEDYVDFKRQDYLGLTNLGATCYFNSLVQQLYHTKFSKLLLERNETALDEMNEMNQSSNMRELKKIFMELCYSIKNVVNPKPFIKSISFYGQPINTSVQQDASQFLLCLFDIIENSGYKTEVHDVFGGFVCNQVTVEDGNQQPFIKNKIQHFNFLSIDIKGKKNLQQALAYMIKPQTLDGQNKYFCEQLGKKMKASQRIYIEKMPNILILTLKRFQFNYDAQARQKLNDYFEFPLDLDLHKYSAACLGTKKQQNSDSKYKLTGILVHSGSAESGHYYSYIKIGELWYEFNDKTVTQFNITNNIKNQCFGCSEGKKTRCAYMLFYQKAHTSYHGVYLNEIPESNPYKRQVIKQNAIFLKNRLIFDENFRKFVQSLKKFDNEDMVQNFLNSIFGKPKKDDYEMIERPSMNSGHKQMIHFDADDENQPLMKDEDLFDILNREN